MCRQTLLKPEILTGHGQQVDPADMAEAEDAGDHLGNQSGCCGSSYAKSQSQDKEKIQNDVDSCCHDHGIQRCPSVSKRTQDACGQIVRHDNGNSQIHDAKIQKGISKDILRGLQKQKHRTGDDLSKYEQHQRGEKRQDHGVPYGFAKFRCSARAEMLCHQDSESLGQSLNDSEHHPVHPVSGAQCGQRMHSKGFSHYHGIHDRIELLKYVADHQRKREGKDQGNRPSFGHRSRLCHIAISSFRSRNDNDYKEEDFASQEKRYFRDPVFRIWNGRILSAFKIETNNSLSRRL